jgi:carbamoyltransferase
VHHVLYRNKQRHPIETVYLGPEYSNQQIEKALKEKGVPYRQSTNITDDTADLLIAGKIVGWFQGRLETGPRALGNRSILADPRPDRTKDHLNARVKHREWFRPFGPSVLAEKANEVFETGDASSPFMLQAFTIRPQWQGKIPAVEHVDHTARIQTVTAKQNPRYHDLLLAFDQKTGVPAILNTSFNVMGEPIVRSPENAIDCFRSTGIDVLCIGDFICEKEK